MSDAAVKEYWCAECRLPVTVSSEPAAAAPGKPSTVTAGAPFPGKAVHTATGLEKGPDGHLAAPVDFQPGAVPTPAELGIGDPAALAWQKSGTDGRIEVAFPPGPSSGEAARSHGDWVLMRVTGDPDGRIEVFHRHEWECFLDGAKSGRPPVIDPGSEATLDPRIVEALEGLRYHYGTEYGFGMGADGQLTGWRLDGTGQPLKSEDLEDPDDPGYPEGLRAVVRADATAARGGHSDPGEGWVP